MRRTSRSTVAWSLPPLVTIGGAVRFQLGPAACGCVPVRHSCCRIIHDRSTVGTSDPRPRPASPGGWSGSVRSAGSPGTAPEGCRQGAAPRRRPVGGSLPAPRPGAGHLRGGRTNAARGARRFHAPGQRRCIVRLSCLGATGAANTRAHLRYLGRDGVEPDGSPGTLYGPDGQRVAPDAFIERAEGDPGQARIMLSPGRCVRIGPTLRRDLRGHGRAGGRP